MSLENYSAMKFKFHLYMTFGWTPSQALQTVTNIPTNKQRRLKHSQLSEVHQCIALLIIQATDEKKLLSSTKSPGAVQGTRTWPISRHAQVFVLGGVWPVWAVPLCLRDCALNPPATVLRHVCLDGCRCIESQISRALLARLFRRRSIDGLIKIVWMNCCRLIAKISGSDSAFF